MVDCMLQINSGKTVGKNNALRPQEHAHIVKKKSISFLLFRKIIKSLQLVKSFQLLEALYVHLDRKKSICVV